MDSKARISNGYRLLYKPDHIRSFSGKNWDGWVYEHVLVAEESIGRPLQRNEVVHHLDLDRSNNRLV